MEAASTAENPASHCITIHRRDGFDLLPVSAVMRAEPSVPVTSPGDEAGRSRNQTSGVAVTVTDLLMPCRSQ
jgi:hypothetical protein